MVKTGRLLGSAVFGLAISVWLASGAEARHRKYKYYDFRYSRQYEDTRQFRQVREYQDDNFREDERRGRGAFASIVVELVHTCSRQTAELDRLPFDAIAQVAHPDDTQRRALDELRSIVATTVDKLTS